MSRPRLLRPHRRRPRLWLVAAMLLALSAASPVRTASAQNQRTLYLPLVQTPTTPRVAAVKANRQRGLYDAPIEVTLASTTEGATILYTTDGSAPGPSHGAVYTSPLALQRPTVLRAAAFRRGWIATPVETWSYLFPTAVSRQSASPEGWPSTWGTYSESHLVGEPVQADYGIDSRVVGDPNQAREFIAALRALPSLSLAIASDDLFDSERGIYAHPIERGAEWERPVSAEWLPPPRSGETAFQIDAGLRIAGNASRKHVSTPKKSFSLRFTRRHGPSKLTHPLFPESRVTRFDVLRLRAVFNDSFLYLPERPQYLRDRWARETQAAMGMLAAEGRFAHLYLNGLYWGVYDLSEEPSASFMVEHRGGSKADWDVVKPTAGGEDGLEDGDRLAFEALLAARDIPGASGLEQIKKLLDVDAYIDYTLLQVFVGNAEYGDNWRAARRKTAPDGDGFIFFAWDFENVLDLLPPRHRFYDAKASTDGADTFGVGGLHGRLRQDPAYRLRFADRAERHLGEGGALSAEEVVARYRKLAERVAPAILTESARWGDHPPTPLALTHGAEIWQDFWDAFGAGQAQTRDQHWQPEVDRLLAFLSTRQAVVRSQLCREGLLPDVIAPRIHPSGVGAQADPNGDGLEPPLPREVIIETGNPSLNCPGAREAVIWYTLDGSDPRQEQGGGFAPTARPVQGPVRLPRGVGLVRVRARARLGSAWSAEVERSFGLPRITIDELHYHPQDAPGVASTEFLELLNHEPVAVDLRDWRVRGIGLIFPAGSRIEAEGRLVVARDPEALRQAADLERAPLGYPGALANGGEDVVIESPRGQRVFAMRYDDGGAWPRAADGHGPSLVRVPNPAPDSTNDPESWRGSRDVGGSPGRAEPAQAPLVVISEILAATEAERRAIELLNLSAESAEIGGWGLGADPEEGPRTALPSDLRLGPGEHIVIADGATSAEGEGIAGLLSEGGGTLLLFPRDAMGPTGDVRGARYGPHDPEISWGRHRSAAGTHFVPLAYPTLGEDPAPGTARLTAGQGEANASPWLGSVALTEIMARPNSMEADGDDEYIEIFNRSRDTVALAPGPSGGGGSSWALTEGVTLRFPPGAILAPRGRLVVTGGDPEAFRSRHNVPRSVPVLGPWQGRLSDEGERVSLARPRPKAHPKAEFEDKSAWIVVETLRYRPDAPWPAGFLDGGGAALERVEIDRLAGDPAAWSALAGGGSPGRPNRPRHRLWLPWLGATMR